LALSRRCAAGLTAALAVTACLLAAGPALGADQRTVKLQDDCDPASFNAVLGPGTCEGDGRTLFGDLIAGAQRVGSVDGWQFSRPEFNIDAGGTIHVVNEGGETHTFTMVEEFGDGCIKDLNPGGLPGTPAADCTKIVPILRGGTADVTVASAETVLFQCMIHPWMHSTVEVRANGNHGGQD
jgi:plastocyanin